MDFATQAESIRKLTEKYNVDTSVLMPPASVSACSSSCARLSRRARYPLHAGNENRNGAQAKDVIRRGCLEYDVSATDITARLWLSARP